jgi:large subunit ribosomal protein L9
VSARDIADASTEAGLSINRSQVVLEHPIKSLGLSQVRVSLHPEVSIPVTVNVARSPEEAERQARGERATGAADDDDDQAPTAENIFEGDTPQPA